MSDWDVVVIGSGFGGAMVAHRGDDLPYPVLANDTYERSVEFAKATGRRAGKACGEVLEPVLDFELKAVGQLPPGGLVAGVECADIVEQGLDQSLLAAQEQVAELLQAAGVLDAARLLGEPPPGLGDPVCERRHGRLRRGPLWL